MNKFALGCGVVLAILLFILVVAALAIGGSYNRLVRLQQAVDQSWAQVQNAYRCGATRTISGSARTTEQCAFAFTGRSGALSRVKSQSEFSQFAGAIGRNGESNLGRARELQYRGAKLQCGGAQFPDQFNRGYAWFCAETILHRARRRGAATACAV